MGTVKAAFLSRINCPGFAVTAKCIQYTDIVYHDLGIWSRLNVLPHTFRQSLHGRCCLPMRFLISPERNRLQKILVSLAAVFSVVTQRSSLQERCLTVTTLKTAVMETEGILEAKKVKSSTAYGLYITPVEMLGLGPFSCQLKQLHRP